MVKAVWKFPVTVDDFVEIEMPEGAKLLHFGLQDEVPMLWALVDPDAPMAPRRFRFAGTGHIIDGSLSLDYVGTIIAHMGRFVWHLFEIQG
jgi:hypothetical protein